MFVAHVAPQVGQGLDGSVAPALTPSVVIYPMQRGDPLATPTGSPVGHANQVVWLRHLPGQGQKCLAQLFLIDHAVKRVG